MMPGTREIVGDIRIFRSYIDERKTRGASCVVREWGDKFKVDYREYTVRDTDPESALAALKEAVKAGEEGRSW